MAGRDDLVDEGGPVVRPFLLEDGHEDEVQLVEKGSLCLERLFRARGLDNEVDDKVADTWSASAYTSHHNLRKQTYLDIAPLARPSTGS